MNWCEILFLAVYACLTLALILLKMCKIGRKRRGVGKMLTSLAFVAVGVLGAVKNGGLTILACVGLFFASLGDLFLIFSGSRKWFLCGVMSFFVASILLSAYSLANFGLVWWALVVFVLLNVGNVLCQKFNVYSYGKNKLYLNLYFIAVSLCGSLGLSLLCQGSPVSAVVFGLGCFCYFASDMFLGLFLFKFRNRVIDSVNSLLYFPGMLLVAIGLLL